MITQSDLAECQKIIDAPEEPPRYDFTGIRAVERFGWHENAAIWRSIMVNAWNAGDLTRVCFAQRVVMMCETFAHELEGNRP